MRDAFAAQNRQLPDFNTWLQGNHAVYRRYFFDKYRKWRNNNGTSTSANQRTLPATAQLTQAIQQETAASTVATTELGTRYRVVDIASGNPEDGRRWPREGDGLC